MTRFGSFNNSTCKKVSNLSGLVFETLEVGINSITVVKFGVNDTGSDGTGYSRIEVRDTATLTNVIVAGFGFILAMNSSSRSLYAVARPRSLSHLLMSFLLTVGAIDPVASIVGVHDGDRSTEAAARVCIVRC